MRNAITASAIGLCLLAGAAQASDMIFSEGFEGTPSSRWSQNLVVDSSERAAFSRFGGRYGNHSLSLTLDAIQPRDIVNDPGHGGGDKPGDGGDGGGDGGGNGGGGDGGGGTMRIVYDLAFDLYVIDTWDGSTTANGPDRFRVLLNGTPIFDETFANQHSIQSFREPDVGRRDLGFREFISDSIYRDITLRFEAPAGERQFTLTWQGLGLQNLHDESWGIDNIGVFALAVPTPASIALLALGGTLAVRRKR